MGVLHTNRVSDDGPDDTSFVTYIDTMSVWGRIASTTDVKHHSYMM